MEVNSLLLLGAFALFMLTLSFRAKEKIITSTAEDWFVIFSVDAETKMLHLWFYPIVGFHLKQDEITPITSRPSMTKSLSARKPAKIVRNEICGVSVSYGRWVRDDALFDEAGNPEVDTFSSIIGSYLLSEFQIYPVTTIPASYQKIIIEKSNLLLNETENNRTVNID